MFSLAWISFFFNVCVLYFAGPLSCSLYPASTYCSEFAFSSSSSSAFLAFHIFGIFGMLLTLFSCVLYFRYIAAIHVLYFILV